MEKECKSDATIGVVRKVNDESQRLLFSANCRAASTHSEWDFEKRRGATSHAEIDSQAPWLRGLSLRMIRGELLAR
jgi:hypothetical protein